MTNDLSSEDWDLYEQQFHSSQPWEELGRVVNGGITLNAPHIPPGAPATAPLQRHEVPTNRIPPNGCAPSARIERKHSALIVVALALWALIGIGLGAYGIFELINQVTR